MRGNYVFTFLTDNEKMNEREIADNWRVRDINHQPPKKKLECLYLATTVCQDIIKSELRRVKRSQVSNKL